MSATMTPWTYASYLEAGESLLAAYEEAFAAQADFQSGFSWRYGR